jgi:hypothetical protein
MLVTVLLTVFISSPAIPAPITFPSGQVYDLSLKQLELLKSEQGVAFFPFQPETLKKEVMPPLILLKIPQVLGGGLLTGTPENLQAGLNAVGAIEVAKKEEVAESAAEREPVLKKETSEIESEFWFTTGYRVDDFDWNIAGDINGNNPNILSELTWDDLKIFQVTLQNKTVFRQTFYFRGSLAYGWILDGENQDSDYNGDNRTLEFSRSNNSADDGDVLDASAGIGYQFTFGFGMDKFGITPLIGYSFHQQNLKISDGFQTIPATGSFPGLASTYDAEWSGPWVGLDIVFKSNKKYNLYAEIEYHWGDYYAEADWNLRTDFAHPKSFEHDADGDGIVLSAGWRYFFDNHWAVNLNFNYQDWSTDNGIDRVFLASGSISETRLNEANWQSFATMIGLAYVF